MIYKNKCYRSKYWNILALNQSSVAQGAGHQALLIGNDKDRWTYIPKDGFAKSAFDLKSLLQRSG